MQAETSSAAAAASLSAGSPAVPPVAAADGEVDFVPETKPDDESSIAKEDEPTDVPKERERAI